MADISGSFDDANEADLIEQARAADGDPQPAAPGSAPDQADEADVLEQGALLPDDDDDAYPYGPDEER